MLVRGERFQEHVGSQAAGVSLYVVGQTCGRESGEHRHMCVERTTTDEPRVKR